MTRKAHCGIFAIIWPIKMPKPKTVKITLSLPPPAQRPCSVIPPLPWTQKTHATSTLSGKPWRYRLPVALCRLWATTRQWTWNLVQAVSKSPLPMTLMTTKQANATICRWLISLIIQRISCQRCRFLLICKPKSHSLRPRLASMQDLSGLPRVKKWLSKARLKAGLKKSNRMI